MEQPNFSVEQAYPRVQSTFFGKVVALFGMAMAVSAVGTFVGFEALPLIMQRPGLIWAIFLVELVLIFTARIWRSARRTISYSMFGLFTFLTGFTLAPLLAMTIAEFGGGIVFKALGATAMMFFATAALGATIKRELRGLGGFLFMFLIGMIVVSLIGVFVPWSNTMEMIVSGAGVFLFSAYTMYDFNRIKQMPDTHEYAMDAALMLYLDIFNLFIFILRLMAALRRN